VDGASIRGQCPIKGVQKTIETALQPDRLERIPENSGKRYVHVDYSWVVANSVKSAGCSPEKEYDVLLQNVRLVAETFKRTAIDVLAARKSDWTVERVNWDHDKGKFYIVLKQVTACASSAVPIILKDTSAIGAPVVADMRCGCGSMGFVSMDEFIEHVVTRHGPDVLSGGGSAAPAVLHDGGGSSAPAVLSGGGSAAPAVLSGGGSAAPAVLSGGGSAAPAVLHDVGGSAAPAVLHDVGDSSAAPMCRYGAKCYNKSCTREHECAYANRCTKEGCKFRHTSPVFCSSFLLGYACRGECPHGKPAHIPYDKLNTPSRKLFLFFFNKDAFEGKHGREVPYLQQHAHNFYLEALEISMHDSVPIGNNAKLCKAWAGECKDMACKRRHVPNPAPVVPPPSMDEVIGKAMASWDSGAFPSLHAPVAASPEPVAASPEPVAASPEPVAASPEPVAASPEPVAASPEPVAASPRRKRAYTL
jgi:hypothetical protein